MSASRRSSENPTKTNKREGSHSKSPALISVRLNEWPRTSSVVDNAASCARYWTTACPKCSLKSQCTTGPEPRITRWEHEHLKRCSNAPTRTCAPCASVAKTVEHPFGTIKTRMGATHFLTTTLPKVAAEMALSVLAYNLARAMNIVGVKPLLAAIRA